MTVQLTTYPTLTSSILNVNTNLTASNASITTLSASNVAMSNATIIQSTISNLSASNITVPGTISGVTVTSSNLFARTTVLSNVTTPLGTFSNIYTSNVYITNSSNNNLSASNISARTIQTSSDVVIGGNLTVNGATTTINATTVMLSNNMIEINDGLVGAPPSTLLSGINVNRGTSSNYYLVYAESNQTFRLGTINNLQAIATRQDVIQHGTISYWDNTRSRYTFASNIVINPANNSIGVGVSNPQYAVDVAGDINVTGAVYVNGQLIQSSGGGSSAFTTTSGQSYLDSGLYLGIGGQSNPQYPLDVLGAVNINGNVGITSNLFVTGLTSINGTLAIGSNVNASKDVNVTGTVNANAISVTSNISAGSLNVSGTSSFSAIVLEIGGGVGSSSGGSGGSGGISGGNGIFLNGVGSTMYVPSGYNIGIGGNSNAQKTLDVTGSVGVSQDLQVNGNAIISSLIFEVAAGTIYATPNSSAPSGTFSNVIVGTSGTGACIIGSTSNLVVNSTPSAALLQVVATSSNNSCISTYTTSNQQPAIQFFNTNGLVGSIRTNGASTSYNTNSDYRVKENVASLSNALDTIEQMKPSTFEFTVDPDHTIMQGFIAHELQECVPNAVSGYKDQTDDDGKPILQSVDYSSLTPLLTAGIKELLQRVQQLEEKITHLHNYEIRMI